MGGQHMPDTDLARINYLAGLGMGPTAIQNTVKRASGQPYTLSGIAKVLAQLRKQKAEPAE